MRTVVERYYEQLFYVDDGNEDLYVNQHTNGLLLLGIAPTHPLLKGKTIFKFEFNKELEDSKGGVILDRRTHIATVTCTDETICICTHCIYGPLLELNENLVSNPDILLKKPGTDGFLAIISPPKEGLFKKNLMSLEEYCNHRNLPIPKQRYASATRDYDFDE